jgi:Amt family ammonium transporter
VIGDLSLFGLNGVGAAPNLIYAPLIPELLFFAFQLKFAAITPALIIGAFAERIHFRSLLIFIILWSTLIYSPVAHWVWNPEDGSEPRFIDSAGGLVTTSPLVFPPSPRDRIGRRKDIEKKETMKPSNIPYVILGASLLWFGWFGFNAGSALAADSIMVYALVNTNLAAAAAACSWMIVDWITKGKPSAVGMAVGAVCGLVAITLPRDT